MDPRSRSRDQRGVAYPAPLVILTVIAVAMAGLAYLVTAGGGADDEIVTAAQPAATESATPEPTVTAEPEQPAEPEEPAIDRAQVFVEVYNNSGIAGLAGRTADAASGVGWQVAGSDNWVGTIPSTTVYYPERLEREAQLLAADLGIERLMPAVDPMRGDRLTIILTSDFA